MCSLRATKGADAAWNRSVQRPAATDAVSLFEAHFWHSQAFGMKTITVSLVARQQNQQQGNQLAKETDRLIKVFSALPVGADQVLAFLFSENQYFGWQSFIFQRQRKIQKERLLNDFSAALNTFQRTQREAADKEREFVARVRASSRVSVNSFGQCCQITPTWLEFILFWWGKACL